MDLDGLPVDHMYRASLAVSALGEALDDYYQKVWGRAKTGDESYTRKRSI
ncbi:MAG: hypothetical protein M0Z56_10565 [Desulfobacteraceae bacterium]|nr:hypothetical protein [Desulfobacteraceae bacterium]